MDNQPQLDQPVDIASLSDDELSNFDLSQLSAPVAEEPEPVVPHTEVAPTPEATEVIANPQAEEAGSLTVVEQPIDSNPEPTSPLEIEPTAGVNEPEPQVTEPTPETKADPDAIDYKAFYDQVTGSFKANGRDIAVKDPAEVVAMMQRGAGFAKKMATLKPSMRVLRTLENHGITEDKLGYLIDLHNKNPEAINKLIKESGVDVYSLDADKADGYQSQVAMATDGEVELDMVVQDLAANSATFQKTINTVVGTWDNSSKQVIAQHPQLLGLLDSHMQLGYFDQVMGEVERLRAIGGRIDGLSDFEAYQQVGDQLNQQGAFAQPKAVAETTPVQPIPTAPAQVAPAPVIQSQSSKTLNDKRRAASAPRPTPVTAQAVPDYDSMSDEQLLASLSIRR